MAYSRIVKPTMPTANDAARRTRRDAPSSSPCKASHPERERARLRGERGHVGHERHRQRRVERADQHERGAPARPVDREEVPHASSRPRGPRPPRRHGPQFEGRRLSGKSRATGQASTRWPIRNIDGQPFSRSCAGVLPAPEDLGPGPVVVADQARRPRRRAPPRRGRGPGPRPARPARGDWFGRLGRARARGRDGVRRCSSLVMAATPYESVGPEWFLTVRSSKNGSRYARQNPQQGGHEK